MNSKLKLFFITVIAVLFVFIICGGTLVASAAETTDDLTTIETDDAENDEEENLVPPADLSGETEEETPATPPAETEENTAIENLAANFVDWLKSTFGADYEYYYNQIIENWGSIENYLLQFGQENIPEQYQTGWEEFIGWLSDNAPVWASILAIAIIIIVWLVGKKVFTSIVKKVVDSKTSALATELNKQSEAMIATNRALSALLGKGEKFSENVKELDETAGKLNS